MTEKYERKPYRILISPRLVTCKPLDRVNMDIYITNNCSFLSIVDLFSKHHVLPKKQQYGSSSTKTH